MRRSSLAVVASLAMLCPPSAPLHAEQEGDAPRAGIFPSRLIPFRIDGQRAFVNISLTHVPIACLQVVGTNCPPNQLHANVFFSSATTRGIPDALRRASVRVTMRASRRSSESLALSRPYSDAGNATYSGILNATRFVPGSTVSVVIEITGGRGRTRLELFDVPIRNGLVLEPVAGG